MEATELESMFSYHPPSEVQIAKYKIIRETAYELAKVINDNTPRCPDQTAAIRLLREAVMTANAAIAIYGR